MFSSHLSWNLLTITERKREFLSPTQFCRITSWSNSHKMLDYFLSLAALMAQCGGTCITRWLMDTKEQIHKKRAAFSCFLSFFPSLFLRQTDQKTKCHIYGCKCTHQDKYKCGVKWYARTNDTQCCTWEQEKCALNYSVKLIKIGVQKRPHEIFRAVS